MSKNENESISRLINVAITRARGKLVVVANKGYWMHRFKDTEHAFKNLVQHISTNEHATGVKEKQLQKYLESMQIGGDIQFFVEQNQAFNVFENDIDKSKKNLYVSIPNGEAFGEFEEEMLKHFLKAKGNGTELAVKAKNTSKLPKSWRAYAWQSDNAIFPTVLVDEKVLWYGFPNACGKFMDGKDSGFTTVCPVWVRFSGQYTVDMIKSLAALDVCSVQNSTFKHASGISAYVAKHEKCHECGNAMFLTKSKNGHPILKCTICGKTELFAKESVNKYITMNRVRCPYCNKDLYADVKSKLYIRCKNGHFPKIEEI